MKRAGNKTYLRAREIRLPLVAKYYTRGYPATEICVKVKADLNLKTYSYKTTRSDIERIKQEWKDERLNDRLDQLNKQIKESEAIKREAWEQFEASKAEGLGAVCYLAEVRHNNEHISDVLQLSKARVDVNFGNIVVNVSNTKEGEAIKSFIEGDQEFGD